MSEQPSALSELRKLGLTIDIDEATAARIWGALLIIDGRVRQGDYREPGDWYFAQNGLNVLDAFHAIAKEIVNSQTPDDILEDMIPRVVHAFYAQQQWYPAAYLFETMKNIMLSGPIQEWKGKRFLMTAENPTKTMSSKQTTSEFPKRADWLRARLKERSWGQSDIDRHSGPDRKTVRRILNGEAVREDVLDRLAKALSQKCHAVDITDIPNE